MRTELIFTRLVTCKPTTSNLPILLSIAHWPKRTQRIQRGWKKPGFPKDCSEGPLQSMNILNRLGRARNQLLLCKQLRFRTLLRQLALFTFTNILVKVKKKKKEIILESNVCRTPKTSIQKPQFENQSFYSNFIERHTFLRAEQREPSLKATKKSAGLLVTGENTTLTR